MLLTIEEWREIVERLTDLTISNHLVWSKQPNGFAVNTGQTAYVLGSVDEDEVAPFFLSILVSGKEYDRYEQPGVRPAGADGVLSGTLSNLQRSVNRQYHKTPDRVRAFIEELGDLAQDPFS